MRHYLLILYFAVVIQKTGIEAFIALAGHYPVLDVRSPGEYAHAHIPGVYNLPLFSDEERKVVGTAYKQEGREQAIKIGLDYFGGKMRKMVEDAEEISKRHRPFKSVQSRGAITDSVKLFNYSKGNTQNEMLADSDLTTFQKLSNLSSDTLNINEHARAWNNATDSTIMNQPKGSVLVHCWRGGMRSAGVAWLLDLYGFKVYTLVGGYKAFRNWALQQFEKQYPFKIIGGYTGSGKTPVLKELAEKGNTIIDLEGIAHHKGSAFGDLGEPRQPAPEMFENKLAMELYRAGDSGEIWLEDESRRIGDLNLPASFWNAMRNAPVFFIEVPFEERLKHIVEEYGKFKKEDLVSAIKRIQKRLGGQNAKNAINYINEDNITQAFRILLAYYDKHYSKGLAERDHLNELLTVIPCTHVDPERNSLLISAKYRIDNGQ